MSKNLTIIAFLLTLAAGAGAQQVLYAFKGGSDGQNPSVSGVIFDPAGNIYGTTGWGGSGPYCNFNFLGPCGTVYELTPNSGGGWTKTTLYNFCSLPDTLPNCADGQYPLGVVRDSAGNLYGVAEFGGANDQSGDGAGVVFELTPNGSTWTERVIYNFCSLQNCADGQYPLANLIMDGKGNLFGTTYVGGSRTSCPSDGCGTVFELSPSGSAWTLTTLHSFSVSDGVNPSAPLLLDAKGNLYGNTPGGGKYSEGVVFELTSSSGGWTEKVLHNFTGKSDGSLPVSPLTFDAAGNLYGTTLFGGSRDKGVAFELVPASGGHWTYKLLHTFAGGQDGANPEAGLIFDTTGNLYGTTTGGGGTGCGGAGCGTIFDLAPKIGGGWIENTLYRFSGPDGASPQNLGKPPRKRGCPGGCSGTTYGGGSTGYGIVFQVVE